jgi:hypothetical protein
VSVVVCDEVLLGRPTVVLLVKKFLPFIRNSASIIVLAKARHCPLHGYFLTSLLILSSPVRLGTSHSLCLQAHGQKFRQFSQLPCVLHIRLISYRFNRLHNADENYTL